MLESIITYFKNLIQYIRFADLIDMGLVSLFFYIFITWIRRSVSYRVVVTVSAFIVIYLLARVFGLYMTETLMQGLVAVSVIVMIVIFQSDIRRMVDWIGSWAFFRQRYPGSSSHLSDILTETAARLAETKTGALIAIKGRESWDREIDGGTEINGAVTQKLLISIFNPKAPGHDGAVLIENEKLVKFGSHLPLSRKIHRYRTGGTRHAAALGLSENCDALIIVVSEERGTISVAENGKLTTLDSASALKSRLEKFRGEHPAAGTKNSKLDLRQKPVLKTALLSIFLTFLLWLAFEFQSEMLYRTLTVPIEFRNLKKNLVIREPVPVEAKVTLYGSSSAFKLLEPAQLVVSLDLKRLNEGSNQFLIAEDNLELPRGLKLYQSDPASIRINARKIIGKKFPIKVSTTGKLPDSLQLVSLNSTPDSIKLMVPSDAVQNPSGIYTEPIDLKELSSSTTLKSRVVISDSSLVLPPDSSPDVTIHIKVQKRP